MKLRLSKYFCFKIRKKDVIEPTEVMLVSDAYETFSQFSDSTMGQSSLTHMESLLIKSYMHRSYDSSSSIGSNKTSE